jgi:hypothetical protein
MPCCAQVLETAQHDGVERDTGVPFALYAEHIQELTLFLRRVLDTPVQPPRETSIKEHRLVLDIADARAVLLGIIELVNV